MAGSPVLVFAHVYIFVIVLHKVYKVQANKVYKQEDHGDIPQHGFISHNHVVQWHSCWHNTSILEGWLYKVYPCMLWIVTVIFLFVYFISQYIHPSLAGQTR